MEAPMHSLNNLFAQLGLPSEDEDIENFIRTHSPIPTDIALSEASFWTPVQAAFLNEEILKNADWAEVIDELNARLHARS